MILDKNKVEKAANDYSINVNGVPTITCEEVVFNASICDFKKGIEWVESQLSELAVEFGKFISNHRLDFQPGDISGEGLFIGLDMKYYSSEELFQEFLKYRNE